MNGKTFAICTGVFAAGFVVGWAAGALIKSKNEELKDNNAEIIPDEIRSEDSFDHFRKRYDTITYSELDKRYSEDEVDAIETAAAEAESPSEDDDDDEEPDSESSNNNEYDPYDDYVDYKPVNPYGEDPEDYEEEGSGRMHKKNVWPYEIDVEEYENDNGYTKSTLEYYKNNVLIDEDGSEITNAGSIIGSGVLKNLMVSKGVAYVRNENLGIDYEIAFINETYESYDDYDD